VEGVLGEESGDKSRQTTPDAIPETESGKKRVSLDLLKQYSDLLMFRFRRSSSSPKNSIAIGLELVSAERLR
jgi:hypothetical protein